MPEPDEIPPSASTVTTRSVEAEATLKSNRGGGVRSEFSFEHPITRAMHANIDQIGFMSPPAHRNSKGALVKPEVERLRNLACLTKCRRAVKPQREVRGGAIVRDAGSLSRMTGAAALLRFALSLDAGCAHTPVAALQTCRLVYQSSTELQLAIEAWPAPTLLARFITRTAPNEFGRPA